MIRSHAKHSGTHSNASAGGVAGVRKVHTARNYDTPSPLEFLRPAEWTEQAACTGLSSPDIDRLFYSRGNPPAEAYELCGGCPVQVPCLADNIDEEYGMFGGKSRAERIALRGPRAGRRAPRHDHHDFSYAS